MSNFMKEMVEGEKCSFHPENNAIDCYTPFGRVEDFEPPDTVFLCQECVIAAIEFARKYDMMPSHWIKADYEIELARELGYHCTNGAWVKNEA